MARSVCPTGGPVNRLRFKRKARAVCWRAP
jgi:hypothetical protein